MKKIYGEGAVSVLPGERSFIFVTRSLEAPEDMTNAGKSVVTYRQHSFDDGQIALVTKSVFLMSKFGVNFEFFSENLPDYVNCKAIQLENGALLVVSHDGSAALFDRENRNKWSGSLKYKGFSPADVIAQGDFLWCSYPESNAVIKYNINSMQQTFRVGGSTSGAIIEPYGLWLEDNQLVITSSADGRISSLDLDSFYLDRIWDIDEPVFQYCKIDSNEIVLTKSGIYRL